MAGLRELGPHAVAVGRCAFGTSVPPRGSPEQMPVSAPKPASSFDPVSALALQLVTYRPMTAVNRRCRFRVPHDLSSFVRSQPAQMFVPQVNAPTIGE